VSGDALRHREVALLSVGSATHPAEPTQRSPPSLPGRSATSVRSESLTGVVHYIPPMAQPPASEFPLGKDGLPDLPLRVLEDDENLPPRPEEELADLERSDLTEADGG